AGVDRLVVVLQVLFRIEVSVHHGGAFSVADPQWRFERRGVALGSSGAARKRRFSGRADHDGSSSTIARARAAETTLPLRLKSSKAWWNARDASSGRSHARRIRPRAISTSPRSSSQSVDAAIVTASLLRRSAVAVLPRRAYSSARRVRRHIWTLRSSGVATSST